MESSTGLYAPYDSGAPPGSTDYTTVVIVHGLAWHSEIFKRLIPRARAHNTRVVTVNRREYPGTTPYPAEELALLPPLAADSSKSEFDSVLEFTLNRGRELLAFLAGLVERCNIPPGRPKENRGGIVVVGWSLGILWMTSLLANLDSFTQSGVDLSKYLRRVILYDGPSFLFGFARPPDDYDPVLILGEFERDPRDVVDWASGYFTHGNTVDSLARRVHDAYPPPTMRTMSDEEQVKLLHTPPASDGGSDLRLITTYRLGVFGKLWRDAITVPEDTDIMTRWEGLEVRVLWCDRSVWEVAHAAWWVEAQVAEARAKGQKIRNVTTMRIRGANHFVHWENPAQTLQAFLNSASPRSTAYSGESPLLVAHL